MYFARKPATSIWKVLQTILSHYYLGCAAMTAKSVSEHRRARFLRSIAAQKQKRVISKNSIFINNNNNNNQQQKQQQ
jgi:hypothetical protein